MNLINALLETYDYALENDLVDNHKLSQNGEVILPIYHSNKKSTGNDIFEIRLDEDGNAIGGRFLNKDEIIIFPITEDSISRAGSKIAPHPLCDELSYLAKEINIDKNQKYLEEVNKLLDYEKEVLKNNNLRILAKYILKNKTLDDFLKLLLGNLKYTIDTIFNLKYETVDSNGKEVNKSIDLNKIFITFKIEKLLSGDMNITRDVNLHNFYIDYVNHMNSKDEKLYQCNVTGELDYCAKNHRGLLGTAKLISISNWKETYYGRIKKGEDIYHISYKTSQKIHNMLKFFLDSDKYKKFIGEDAYVINWLAHDLNKGRFELISNIYEEDDELEVEEITMGRLGDEISRKLGDYFQGSNENFKSNDDFYVLIVEKISNGRISIKYFRQLSSSEAYNRLKGWYESTNWKFYGEIKSPSIFQIVNFIYGEENSKGYLSCENKKLSRSAVERLLPCIIDSKKIPKDILMNAVNKLSKRMSYKKTWDTAISIGCSLIKKYKKDYYNYNINLENMGEVKELKESKGFYYGRLIAIYEKIELDAIRGRNLDGKNEEKSRVNRITNSDRLWSSMIRSPERTRFILESKVKPYMNMLKKNNTGAYITFDKLLTEITLKLIDLDSNQAVNSLDEDFILGYYYQKSKFYTKQVKVEENGI